MGGFQKGQGNSVYKKQIVQSGDERRESRQILLQKAYSDPNAVEVGVIVIHAQKEIVVQDAPINIIQYNE